VARRGKSSLDARWRRLANDLLALLHGVAETSERVPWRCPSAAAPSRSRQPVDGSFLAAPAALMTVVRDAQRTLEDALFHARLLVGTELLDGWQVRARDWRCVTRATSSLYRQRAFFRARTEALPRHAQRRARARAGGAGRLPRRG
jgi:hypothetical protein